MASILATSIDLTKIPKDKIIEDERNAKQDKVYLGNVKVVWTNGENVAAAPRDGGPAPVQQAAVAQADDDLPF